MHLQTRLRNIFQSLSIYSSIQNINKTQKIKSSNQYFKINIFKFIGFMFLLLIMK